MLDICRCDAKLKGLKLCPLRESCLRFTLPVDEKELYSWFAEAPYDYDSSKCEHMISVKARSVSKHVKGTTDAVSAGEYT